MLNFDFIKSIKRFALIFALLAICYPSNIQAKDGIKSYVDFLQAQRTSAKDYVFKLFEKYDVVILCERDHRDITQYDLLLDIFKDKRFTKDIRNAYFEIGNSAYNDTLNRFLHSSNLTPAQVDEAVMSFQRNCHGAGMWEKANYSYNLKGVYDINKNLPNNEKISVRGLDIGVDWATATVEDLRERDALQAVRDSVMGVHFISYFSRQNTKKALVVLNFRHAFLQDMFGEIVNAGRFIAEKYKGRVANVYINSFAFTENPEFPDNVALIHGGKWDAAFAKVEKNNVGFDFANTPFGRDSLDMFPLPNSFKYGDIFTGYIYYQYFFDIKVVSGLKNFIDDKFAPELMRRYRLEQMLHNHEMPYIEKLKKYYNTVTEKTYRQAYPHLQKYVSKWLE
jgi:hypothetical protein